MLQLGAATSTRQQVMDERCIRTVLLTLAHALYTTYATSLCDRVLCDASVDQQVAVKTLYYS
jgi:hypothetical protein